MLPLVLSANVPSSASKNQAKTNLFTTVRGLKRSVQMVWSAVTSFVIPVLPKKLEMLRVPGEATGLNNSEF